MYRLYCCFLIALFLTGCAITDGGRLAGVFPDSSSSDPSNSYASNSDPSDPDSYKHELQTLFEQPYIDPLTDYLIEHQGDPKRAATLLKIRKERDLRCKIVAVEYANEPAIEAELERYNLGYGYSCPQQVALFKERVNRQKKVQQEPVPTTELQPEPKSEPVTVQAPVPVDSTDDNGVSDQALSDCYLLTTIRNFSAARKACFDPADKGDVRSQANMALIAYAFEDYLNALQWAEKAASASGDAAFLLGQMYANGRGVSQNADQAVYWYTIAARQGHKEARVALDSRIKNGPAGDI